jgi:hypothetical protein
MDADTLSLIGTSAVVSALVGGLVTFWSQNRLLARKAALDYEFEAKKRLYEAVGPLRLQLLLAARDVVRRMGTHHLRKWNMNASDYYVKSCVYRLLAPLAVGQLIERKMSVVDFTVDPDAIELLAFVTAAERMWTGPEGSMDHPKTDWSTQSQHLFRDNLRAAAAALIATDSDSSKRIIDFAEFDREYDLLETDSLRDLGKIFQNCTASLLENPIFWARMIGYAYACSELIKSEPARLLGFTPRSLPIDEMILATNDDHYISRADQFKQTLQATLEEGF